MKKPFAIILLLTVALAACSSSPSAADTDPSDINLPDWIYDLPPENVLWGIGCAQEGMALAEVRARDQIAFHVNYRVVNDLEEYLGSGSGASMTEGMRQLNAALSTAQPIKQWQAKDGTWWCLVECKIPDEVAIIIRGEQEAAYAQFKAEQALGTLDVELAKREKPLVVSE